MTARDVWRWTDERGVQRLVGTDELRAALASSILPPSTLVWREGMKEWAAASTMPELASAAFAAGAESLVGAVEPPVAMGGAPVAPVDDPSTTEDAKPAPKPPAPRDAAEPFDPRSTAARRATLVGLPPPVEFPLPAVAKPADSPIAVPGAGERSPVTQTAPFGAPVAPRVPMAGLGDKLKPRRTITATGVDANWATTTRSDEDDTIPRRARPSELAAAAAAAAEATSSLREVRGRPRMDSEPRRPTPPPIPKVGPAPRPPVPVVAPRSPVSIGAPPEAVPAAAPKPPAVAAPKPPAVPAPKPPVVAAPKPTGEVPKPPGEDGAVPGPPRRPAPPKPPVRVQAPPPPPRPIRAPSAPSVRVSPPVTVPGPPRQEADALGDTARPDVAAVPFDMGLHGSPGPAVTLTGPGLLAAQPLPLSAVPSTLPSPATTDAAPALVEAPSPAPETLGPPDARAPEQSKVITKTLASGRDSIESVPGLAEVVAAAPAPERASGHDLRQDLRPEPRSSGGGFDEKTEQLIAPTRANGAARELDVADFEEAVTDSLRGPQAAGHDAVPEHEPRPRPPALSSPRSDPPAPLLPPLHAARPPLPSYPRPTPTPVMAEPAPAPAPEAASRAPDAAPAEEPNARPAGISVRPPADDPAGDVEVRLHAPRRPLGELVSVPLSSLLGAGGLLIGMVVAAFFVGRASSSSAPRLTAHPSLAAVPALAHAALPPPPKPCWMAKQPAMWAPQASRTIPFDAVATKAGAVAIGYARDARRAMGIEVDLTSGEVRARLDDNAKEEIERVVPTPDVEFRVARAGGGGALASPIRGAGDAALRRGPRRGRDRAGRAPGGSAGPALAAPRCRR